MKRNFVSKISAMNLFFPNRMICPNGFKIFHHAFIKAVTCDRGAVADDDELAAGAGEGDVHAARISEEADFTFTVRADEADDHGFFFASLKTVHAVYFYTA